MIPLNQLKEKAKKTKKENQKLTHQLKSKKNQFIDSLFHQTHDEVFSCTDCLKCANCCKTTGPKFTEKDIDRIAKHLGIKPGNFIDKYLQMDEEKDWVLQQVPCVFLAADNYCSIYEVRPKACKEYPHTDRVNQYQLLNLHLKNSEICPAVFDIFEQIKKASI